MNYKEYTIYIHMSMSQINDNKPVIFCQVSRRPIDNFHDKTVIHICGVEIFNYVRKFNDVFNIFNLNKKYKNFVNPEHSCYAQYDGTINYINGTINRWRREIKAQLLTIFIIMRRHGRFGKPVRRLIIDFI